ncbi:unnamed protein product [Heterobilharzia americana]|nr:unnamed protein product [Heterobilharzia americana]
MSSGIKPTVECENLYKSLKMGNTYRYILYVISDQQEIVVEKTAKRDATFQEFREDILRLEGKGCYAVIDQECEGTKGSNLIFLSCLPVRRRMLYSSSKEALKKRLEGLKADVHVSDVAVVTEELLVNEVKKKSVT